MKIVLRLFPAVATRAFWAIGGDDNFGRQFGATILNIYWNCIEIFFQYIPYTGLEPITGSSRPQNYRL